MDKLKSLILFLTLLVGQAQALEGINVLGLVESSLKELNDPFRIKCGQDIQEKSECPYMARQFEHDSQTGLFFWMLSDSPWESCKKTVPSIDAISSSDLERAYAGSTLRDLGLREDYFSKTFNKCFDQNYKSSKQIETQKKVALSMSYNYLNKIGDNTQKLSREIIQINSVIGNKLDDGLPCGKYNLPKNAHLCEKLKSESCGPQNGLAELSDHLFEDAIAPIIAISKKMKEVRRKYNGRGGSVIRQKKLRELKSAIAFIKAENSLLQGDKTVEYIERIVEGDIESPSRINFKKVLKDQLISNKRALKEKIDKHFSMGNCILYGDDGNCDEFEDEFRKIPYQSTSFDFKRNEILASPKSREQQLAREELYQLPECLDRTRDLKNDFNSFAAKTSLNIGLTLVTGGAALAVRAGQLGRIALTARAAAIGADSTFLYKSIDESMDICNEELNKLEVVNNEGSVFSCPKKADEGIHYLKKRDMKACVTASLLSSLDALPFLPAFSGQIARAIHDPFIPKATFKATKEESDILQSSVFRRCIGNRSSKGCANFSAENSKTIEGMHKKCLDPKILSANKEMCIGLEKFANNNSVLRLSEMVPEGDRGKSVVVEFNSGRGHITLRYFKEVEENGEKVMKAFSFDGSSWLLPRRVNGRTFASNKKADSFESLDQVVPGSHYVLDISPAQLETIHQVAKKGGISKACTHDARIALDEAGILSMPKGLSKTFDKITIKKLAKDLTAKYGPPKHSTIKALEDGLESSKAGFSNEQWKTFAVTEFGWLVLTPVAVGGVYPAGAVVGGMTTVVVVDQAGETIAMTRDKFNKLIDELKKQ